MKIGEAFIKAGLIDHDHLKSALTEQEQTHERLGDILIHQGVIASEAMPPALAQYFRIPFIRLKDEYQRIPQKVLEIVPREFAKRYCVVPIELNDSTLTIAIADPLNFSVIDELRIKTKYKIQYMMASEPEIKEAIEYCYHSSSHMEQCIDHFINFQEQSYKVEEDSTEPHYEADDQPVVQYVKSLIVHAVNSRASDVLMQTKEKIVSLRFRVDGMLYEIDPPPKVMFSAIITRIKILAGMDIAERRLPQDGRFKVAIGTRTIDIRTSTFPTIYGESVVLRLLDVSQPLLGMENLGLSPTDIVKFKELIHYSYGLILVTGPTGSGKTTTLYTALNEIKTLQKNIITLEDPVEYRLPFLQQAQVNSQIGFTFAKGLRSILRQDPDIIMVGEIRDKETAEIAIHASLTGHLVFSTLHTNDSAGAIIRLINMGIEPFLISSSLLGVVAQRLIRTICPHCRESYEVDKGLLKKLELNHGITKFYRGKGCDKCLHSGYQGRKGIFELLVPNQTVRRYITENRSSEDIRKAAQEVGLQTLRETSREKLKEGLTTPEELLRVTQETGM